MTAKILRGEVKDLHDGTNNLWSEVERVKNKALTPMPIAENLDSKMIGYLLVAVQSFLHAGKEKHRMIAWVFANH